MKRPALPWFLYPVLAAYALALYVSAPPWPDDWDGIGFIQSVRDFDLARFRPHPPGYPVYVALLRVADFAVRDPARACMVVAACSVAGAIGLVWAATRRLAGTWAACATAALIAALPLVWHAGSSVGSEAPAFACAAACAWGLAARGTERPAAWKDSLVLGLGAGLGLGVRLSWAPLYLAALALAPRGQRVRAWGTALAACAVWAVPMTAVVGGSRLVELAGAQLAGHLVRWGGTMATQPGAVRLVWLARDVIVDGFGAGGDTLGVVIALLVAAGGVSALRWLGCGGVARLALGPRPSRSVSRLDRARPELARSASPRATARCLAGRRPGAAGGSIAATAGNRMCANAARLRAHRARRPRPASNGAGGAAARRAGTRPARRNQAARIRSRERALLRARRSRRRRIPGELVGRCPGAARPDGPAPIARVGDERGRAGR